MRVTVREPSRYLNNAKDTLKKAGVVDNKYYADEKHVREACGTAYLAVLKAIDEYLLANGLSKKELPKSVDAYRKALRTHGAIHDGKLSREFEFLYDELHIAGYYRGMLHSIGVLREAFKMAKSFIDKLG
jgi:hypothetical protein